MTPGKLQELLRKSWSRETSADPKNWSSKNPAWGQCAVSAVVGKDFRGGELVRGDAIIDGVIYSHYWNCFADGDYDFTKEQFPPGTQIKEKLLRTKEYVLGFPETRKRYAILRLAVENQINPNPLFSDPIYRMCFEAAQKSECQKMRFGCLVLYKQVGRKEKIVAATTNETIEPLRDMCEPECIRFKIRSRTESMLGACGHAEEWAIWETIKQKIPLERCSFHVAGFNTKDNKPWIKKEKVHTCLRCAVQLYMANVNKIYVPVVDRWECLTPAEALKTAKEYALKEKIITESRSR